MNLLFTILAASIVPLLSATSVRIRSTESWIHGDLCNNDILSLRLPTSTIPRNFIASPSVRCVNISSNELDSIEEGAFDQLPNLEYLNLRRNRIPSSNLLSFGNLTNIKKLILSDNVREYYYVGSINVRAVYPRLQYLDLRNTRANRIETYEENPFPELKYLDLSQNSINVIKLNVFEKLTHLSLAMNDIEQVSLTELSNLSFLNLDSNSIIQIGSDYNGVDLTGLTKLNYLSLANNAIKVIYRGAFRDTVNLRYLNISRTTLSNLDAETLYDLKSLEVLILDYNNFSAVPIMPTPMNLTTLSMKYNNVMNITNNSTNLPYLKTLLLSDNNITNIFPRMFESYEVLEELYLDGNQITSLPRGWCGSMRMLRLLDLSRNKFTVLKSIFNSYAPSLQSIYIENNPLEYIDSSTFEIIPTNTTIYFKHSVNRTTDLTK